MDLTKLNAEQRELLEEIKKQTGSMMMERARAEKERKVRNYKILNRAAKKGAVLFTGSSLMEQFPVCEMARSKGIDAAEPAAAAIMPNFEPKPSRFLFSSVIVFQLLRFLVFSIILILCCKNKK